MNCNFTEKISSLIDGELPQAEAREVERHLLNCTECEQLRADFLNLRSQIAGFESSVEPVVQNRALKKILAPERTVPVRGLRWSFGTQAVAFATFLIVVGIIGFGIYQSFYTPEQRLAVQTPAPVPSASVQPKQPEPEASPSPKKDNEDIFFSISKEDNLIKSPLYACQYNFEKAD